MKSSNQQNVANIFISEKYKKIVNRNFLKKLVLGTLSHQEQNNVELSIIIDDDVEISKLNEQFRNIKGSTDVLSFPTNEIDPTTDRRIIGDVFISIPDVEVHAVEFGHALLDELSIIIIHGILHLLGYDHSSEEEEKVMWTTQDRVVNFLKEKIFDK